jgi:GntR family transcriptional regulator
VKSRLIPIPPTLQWDDRLPLDRQVRGRLAAMIREGALKAGDRLPSVGHIRDELGLSALIVLRAYQMLLDERLVEKRRGRGMYVSHGARKALTRFGQAALPQANH